jgi:succinate dehydrogenase / fumarate reductase, cytochrome b subunit
MTPSTPDRQKRAPIRNLTLPDLLSYRLPPPGVVSILHRVSGVLMFLFLPLVLWLFEASLSSERSFERFVAFCRPWPVRLLLLVLGWSLLHHLCAGVRFLLLDIHLGTERLQARRSSMIVFAVSGALALVLAWFLFVGVR